MSFGISGLTPYANKAIPLPQGSLAAASITSSYTLIGTIFSNPVVLLIIVSTLDQPVQASFDGINDFVPVVAGSTIVLDFRSDQVCIPGQFGIYVKEIGDPTSGNIYVSAISI